MTSSINQLRLNMLDLQSYQAMRPNKITLENLVNEQEKDEKIFAKKGQDNYNEAMDFNGDGVVTYDEYMRYCEENAVSQYDKNPSIKFVTTIQEADTGQIRPIHIGKVTYSFWDEEKLKPYIETEI